MPASSKQRDPGPYLKRAIIRWDDIEDRDQFPFALPAVKALDGLQFHPHVTFLIGENGSGKLTLIEALAGAWGFNPEGGSKNFNFATHRSESILSEYLTLVRGDVRPSDGFFLRAESFYNVASEIERIGGGILGSYGGKSLHDQSHGESFLTLLTERFFGWGLYFLDEPEAALSPSRQLTFILRLHQLVEEGSQLVIATHSPIIMAYPHATILRLDSNGIEQIRYEDTDHYVVTKYVLQNPAEFMKRLLKG